MVALHLIPIHRALAIEFQAIGRDGQYAIIPMFMDDNRWLPAGQTAMIPREEAESGEDGTLLTIGEVVILFRGEDLIIENKGLPFGKCNAAGYYRALEKARAAFGAPLRGEPGGAGGAPLRLGAGELSELSEQG